MIDSLPFDLLGEILSKLNPKAVAIMQCVDKSISSHISNDPYFKSHVKGSIPKPSDSNSSPDRYESTPSLSSAMEVDEKVDVMNVDHDDKPNSGLGIMMNLIGKFSPYAPQLVNKKETRVGKRLLIEDVKMDVQSSSSSYKRRRV